KETVNMVEKMRQLRLGPPPTSGAAAERSRRAPPLDAKPEGVRKAIDDLKAGGPLPRPGMGYLNDAAPKAADGEAREAAKRARAEEAKVEARAVPKDATVEDVRKAAADPDASGGRHRRAAKYLAEVEKKAADKGAQEAAREALAAAKADARPDPGDN